MEKRHLILSLRGDMHAQLVEFALERAGMSPVYLYTERLSEECRVRIAIDRGEWLPIALDSDRFGSITEEEIGAVWYRRQPVPILPAIDAPEAERRAMRQEWEAFTLGLINAMCKHARWINRPREQLLAECKPSQLIAALQAGLQVPRTLMGNDPAAIREFVGAQESIYKGFRALAFKTEQGQRQLFTMPVRAQDLSPDDAYVQVLPGIFQEKIRKFSDVRIFIVGDEVAAIEMTVSDNPFGVNDMRATPLWRRRGRVLAVPPAVLDKCRKVLGAMGLVTGSFDFIRTEDDDYVFLEVNSAGQFIWMEDVAPECRVLSKFLNSFTGTRLFDNVEMQALRSKFQALQKNAA